MYILRIRQAITEVKVHCTSACIMMR